MIGAVDVSFLFNMAINNYHTNYIVKFDKFAASIADSIHDCSDRGQKKGGMNDD